MDSHLFHLGFLYQKTTNIFYYQVKRVHAKAKQRGSDTNSASALMGREYLSNTQNTVKAHPDVRKFVT